ncbi:hypothetical protein HKBW3S03_02148, partial [Candidatus Hakubella thermalkaliphila]
GLIDDEFDADYVVEKDYGHTILGGETVDADRLLERLTVGINEAKKNGISEAQFEHFRRKAMGEFLKSFNSLEFITNNFLAYHFRQINFFTYLDVLQSVTLTDVNSRLHQHLVEDSMVKSLILPKKG